MILKEKHQFLDWMVEGKNFFYNLNENFDETYTITIFFKKKENLVCILTLDKNDNIIDRWWRRKNFYSQFCLKSSNLEDFCIDFKKEFIDY